MREIKFRAWDGNRYFYNVGIQPLGVIIYEDVGNKMVVPSQVGFIGIDCDELYVEQFTGLLDCNGKEIYEGDILRQKSYNNKWIESGPVIYHHDCFLIEVDKHFHRNARIDSDCEVIGNIHECAKDKT